MSNRIVQIFQDDGAADVRETYRTKLLLGRTDEEAEAEIIEAHKDDFDLSFWLALALAEWQVGRLTEPTRQKGLEAIDEELSEITELWKPEYVSKRQIVLEQARQTLLSPVPPRKKLRMPPWAWKCPWPDGSILRYKLDYPKENNPFLNEYVLLQILGTSEILPDRLPIQRMAVGLLNWHSPVRPESMKDVPETLELIDFVTRDKSRCEYFVFAYQAEHKRANELKCIGALPLTKPHPLPPRICPRMSYFEEDICRALKLQEENNRE